MTTTTVVDKIRKLLNLAKSSNVNEAASAAAMAQELMLAHKIEVADIEITTGTKEADEDIEDETLEDHGRRKQRWRTSLASSLARAFGCRIYYHGARIQVVGTPSNISTVKYMQGYLCLEIHRLCEEAIRLEGPTHERGEARVWKNNFKDGAVHAIWEKLYRQRKEQEERFKQTASNALVLVKTNEAANMARVDAELKNIFGGKRGRTVSFGGQGNRAAYSAGKAAGASINLGGNSRSLGAKKTQIEGA